MRKLIGFSLTLTGDVTAVSSDAIKIGLNSDVSR